MTFFHSDGRANTEADFPSVSLWHPGRKTARDEAARVLIELRDERRDERDWIATGHPDPFEVGAGRHPGGQWILRYSDLSVGAGCRKSESDCQDEVPTPSVDKTLTRTKSAAGAWKGIIDAGKLKQTLCEIPTPPAVSTQRSSPPGPARSICRACPPASRGRSDPSRTLSPRTSASPPARSGRSR